MPFFSGKFFCFSCTSRRTEEVREVKTRRASYSTSLRGNLVRTYKSPIEDDYYIDNEHELGKGGCGVVVVGEHKESHAQYAIKIVNKTTAERGRLDRELKLLKDVDHANIVRLFSLYDVPGHMYFVMELCLGGHLGNLLSRQPAKCVDEDWARKLSAQLISAVAHIHSRGIAHRDIKLQNILVDVTNDRQAQLKLIDFGYGSRFIGALPMKTKCGTPYTTAPEVIRECYDERCDVWSMGVVIYIMLCGRRPFEALDIPGPLSDAGKASMITNILAGRYHFNHKAWQNVSKNGINFVKMLLHPDYKTRIYSHEALEVPWLREGTMHSAQSAMLKSSKSFRAVFNMKKNTEASDLQRTGMLALVFGINSKAAADLRNVFQSFDSDHSGMLSRLEFEKAIHEISPELSSADINRLFDMIDIDKNKQISFSEFLAATLDPNEVDIEELSKAFKLLDEDGNGYITREELRKVLIFQYEQANTNNWTLSNNAVRRNSRDLRNVGNIEQLYSTVEDKINRIFDQVDVNNDGFISHGEFLCAMTGLDYYLDSEPFHREPGDYDDSDEGDNSESEEEDNAAAAAAAPPMGALKVQLSAQSSNKYRDQDLQDLTNNEFEFNEEEADPVDAELKKASLNAKAAQQQSSLKQTPANNTSTTPTAGGAAAAVGSSGMKSPTRSPPPAATAAAVAVGGGSGRGRDASPVRNNVASPTFVPINTKMDPSLTGSKDNHSPTGLNIRTTSLDRHTKISVVGGGVNGGPSATAAAGGGGASSAAMKVVASDNNIQYGGSAGSSAKNVSTPTSVTAGAIVGKVDLQYANSQKAGTPEASPRRGNLAFYDVEQNIKVAEQSSHDDELDSGNTSAMLNNVHKAASSARNSPTKMAPIKRDNSSVSTGTGGGGNTTGATSLASNNAASTSALSRDSPNRLSGRQTSGTGAAMGGPSGGSSSSKGPSMSVNKSGKQSTIVIDTSSQFKAGIAVADDESEDKPVAESTRGSFVKLGNTTRQRSYRNTTIIDDEKNVPIKVYEVTTTTEQVDTLKDDGDYLDNEDGDHTERHTRRVSRANIKTNNSHPYEAVLEHIESPPPLLKAGSKAFSFSLKRADSSNYVNTDDLPAKEKGTPMLGSLRKMISGGKLAV